MIRIICLMFLSFASAAAAADCTQDFDRSAKKNSDFVVALRCLESAAKGDHSLPIGSIVVSTLPPSDFAIQVGDAQAFSAKTSRWVLADGRDVSDSKYRLVAASRTVPDLRGVFLRGINAGRNDEFQDPDGDRKPGEMQADDFKSHTHELSYKQWGLASGKGGGDLESGAPGVHTKPSGGKETRPRNAAVYYYIKIN